MGTQPNLKKIPDDELLRSLSRVLKQSRRTEADLVAHIAEVDQRRLYAREASPSMHAYCIDVLHLSEPETALRIHVARGSRKHPMLLEMLRDGRLHLSGVAVLAPHLTVQNRRGLFKRATHKSKRQIEEIVAELSPRPGTAASMRKLPSRRVVSDMAPQHRLGDVESSKPLDEKGLHRQHRPDDVGSFKLLNGNQLGREQRPDDVALGNPGSAAPPQRRATMEPLGTARYQVKFTADRELHDKLERLQALMGTTVPDGDLGAIIEAAVTEKLERLEARRPGKTKRPRKSLAETDATPTSRHIPAAVRRAVWERDGGRCTYADRYGRRCPACDRLEFHHHGRPFGRGGDHSPGNVRLACKAHNALMAELEYGTEKMARYRRQAPGDSVSVSRPVVAHSARPYSGPRPPSPG